MEHLLSTDNAESATAALMAHMEEGNATVTDRLLSGVYREGRMGADIPEVEMEMVGWDVRHHVEGIATLFARLGMDDFNLKAWLDRMAKGSHTGWQSAEQRLDRMTAELRALLNENPSWNGPDDPSAGAHRCELEQMDASVQAKMEAIRELEGQVILLQHAHLAMEQTYQDLVGEAWVPQWERKGFKRSITMTGATADAESWLASREADERDARTFDGFRLCVVGTGRETDVSAIYNGLDRILKHLRATKGADLPVILMHGGAPGADRIAASWARNRGIDAVRFVPRRADGPGKAFRKVERMLKAALDGADKGAGLVAFSTKDGEAAGLRDHAVDTAKQLGIKVARL